MDHARPFGHLAVTEVPEILQLSPWERETIQVTVLPEQAMISSPACAPGCGLI